MIIRALEHVVERDSSRERELTLLGVGVATDGEEDLEIPLGLLHEVQLLEDTIKVVPRLRPGVTIVCAAESGN